jgi:hypothetical protein
MMTDRDVWTAAGMLVKEHGEHAAIVAAQRANEFMSKGDMDGRRLWMRITKTAASLIDPPDGQTVN